LAYAPKAVKCSFSLKTTFPIATLLVSFNILTSKEYALREAPFLSYQDLVQHNSFSFLIAAVLLFLLPVPVTVLAESPIFGLQEIKDQNIDWIDLNKRRPSQEGERSTDILSVDYHSNGKILNATVWLYFPFENEPTSYNAMNYGMYIDSDFDKTTGYGGIDYQLEIGWNNNSKTWTKLLEKWSPNGDEKTIRVENNYTGFFEEDKKYVELSLDLGLLEYPSKYKIAFYAEAKKEKSSSLLTDFTKWVAIPPLELTISTSPTLIELHRGEEKSIEIEVNSSQGYEPKVEISAKSQTDAIEYKFNQNDTLHVPTYGVATTPLAIKALRDADAGQYTLILFANSTFPPEQLIEDIAENNSGLVPDISENIFAQSSILVNILEPLTWDEDVGKFWSNIGGPASFFYGILAGLAPWIYNSIIKRKKEFRPK
jgi:hypothetical protein